MAGFVPNEGETLIGTIILKRTLTDRDAGLELGLFTNSAATESLTEATVTEPTGGGYARIDLADASWTESPQGVFTYATQTFTATGSAYAGSVYGYFIATKSAGGTQRLVAVEIDANGPYTMSENDTYDIDLSNTFS